MGANAPFFICVCARPQRPLSDSPRLRNQAGGTRMVLTTIFFAGEKTGGREKIGGHAFTATAVWCIGASNPGVAPFLEETQHSNSLGTNADSR